MVGHVRRQPTNSVASLLRHNNAPVNRTRGKLQALRNFHAGKHFAANAKLAKNARNAKNANAKKRELAALLQFLLEALSKRSTASAARFVVGTKRAAYSITNKSHWFTWGRVYVLWFDIKSPNFEAELWLDYHGMPLRFAEVRARNGATVKVSKWLGSALELESTGNWAPELRAEVQRVVTPYLK